MVHTYNNIIICILYTSYHIVMRSCVPGGDRAGGRSVNYVGAKEVI